MKFIDIEHCSDEDCEQFGPFDLIVIGGGAAGLTLVRELSGSGIRIALVESGGLEQTEQHESLNQVDASGDLLEPMLQKARRDFHGPQLKYWREGIQKFGVRCRVLGGSTEGWAGKVAPFDDLDFKARYWIENSGWPILREDLLPFLERAAAHLDLGPLIHDRKFWMSADTREPEKIARLQFFHSFFWQFARSRSHLTDVMRFGADFANFHDADVSLFLNATVTSLAVTDSQVSGASVISSLTGGRKLRLRASHVVLAAGAIENARLLLLSKRSLDSSLGDTHGVIGQYLMDHPSIKIGAFDAEHRDAAAKMLGFFPLQKNLRVYIYSHGLALRSDIQRELRLPNMAVFAVPDLSDKDPLVALSRLGSGKSINLLNDAWIVIVNMPLVVIAIGRKLINYRKIPLRLRRWISDIVIKIDANLVARDYQSRGKGRKLNGLNVYLISEQPPRPSNRVDLSERCDRLGVPLARVHWSIGSELHEAINKLTRLLSDDFAAAGLHGFSLTPEVVEEGSSRLLIHDMAHTAGTTRMGSDPKTSAVDVDCQLHGVSGLYLAGASVFPTSGHANPTLMILALTIRLADYLRPRIAAARLNELRQGVVYTRLKPLILVTGATGNIGTEVVAHLIAKGYRVRGTFRNRLPRVASVEWVRIDFSNPDLSDEWLSQLITGVDGIINLAASLSVIDEMEVVNVRNLARLANIAQSAGVRYFCQASSIVVYGSPRERLVDEGSPVIDTEAPIEKQFMAENYMRQYARTKVLGEKVLAPFGSTMKIDICRIAVAQPIEFLDQSLSWGRTRRVFSLYRNSHFVATHEVARAMTHLTELALSAGCVGVEVYNISDANSMTYADHYRASGRSTGFYLPVVLDLLKGFAISRTLQFRRPLGWFRVSSAKLEATGFVFRPSPVTRTAARSLN